MGENRWTHRKLIQTWGKNTERNNRTRISNWVPSCCEGRKYPWAGERVSGKPSASTWAWCVLIVSALVQLIKRRHEASLKEEAPELGHSWCELLADRDLWSQLLHLFVQLAPEPQAVSQFRDCINQQTWSTLHTETAIFEGPIDHDVELNPYCCCLATELKLDMTRKF